MAININSLKNYLKKNFFMRKIILLINISIDGCGDHTVAVAADD
jgi:hypothetical protein